MAPVCAWNIGPPVEAAREIDGIPRLIENNRRRHEQLGLCAGIVIGIRRALSKRDVMRFFDEMLPLLVGYRAAVHPETIYSDLVYRSFLGVELLRAHLKRSSGYPNH